MINQQFTIPFQSNYCAQAVNGIALSPLRVDVFIAVYSELAGHRCIFRPIVNANPAHRPDLVFTMTGICTYQPQF
jgi:hypothetical protein